MLKGIEVGTKVVTRGGAILEFVEFVNTNRDYKHIFKNTETGDCRAWLPYQNRY